MDSKTVREKHREFLFPCVITYYEEPLPIARGEGCRVSDLDGREYIDCFGGILTVSLSHCHPEVVEATSKQMRTLGHVSTLYPIEGQVRVAERLAGMTPGKLKKCFFTNSGTEADDTAVMLAKIHTGRQELIALRHGYSGRAHLSVGLCGVSSWRSLPSPIAGVVHGLSPYCYRCPFGQEYPSCDLRCARDLEELILTETCGRPAAFLAEPVQGVGGFIVPPKEYFQIAVEIVRKYGGLFICDEVQTGFGRTGDRWFGIEHWGVEPEIMTFAKGIANGMPVGATIAVDEVADSFAGLSISTFGGNPVCMAATEASFDVMQREDTPRLCAERGAQIREHLLAMKDKFPFIGDVRGKGLMLAIELVEDRKTREPSPQKTNALMEASKRLGLLVGKGGLYGNTIRFAPPMLISEDEVAEANRRFEQALDEVG